MVDELGILRAARSTREALYAVHYACQNLTELKSAPASVSCISFYDVNAGTAHAFGVANSGNASTPENEREILLLEAALKFMRDHGEARWLHWKMNRPEYGFEALADRLTWLGKDAPTLPPSDRRHDLEAMIAGRHGPDYAPHPRLPNLLARNGISSRYARWGADEPALVTRGEFTAVQQSTTEKVRLLSEVLIRLMQGKLQTENSAGEIGFAGEHLEVVRTVLALADRMLLVQRSLLRRHDNRPTIKINDEYDVQDLFRSLLTIFFEDVRDEEWTPSYAGASSRIDFLLPQAKVAVELKKSRATMTTRKLGEELLVDRERYHAHPNVSHLVCLVFDHDSHLPNPRGLEQDLDQLGDDESLACTVRILDR